MQSDTTARIPWTPLAIEGRLQLVVECLEDGGEVLGVGEESYDVEVVCAHEVEPSARNPSMCRSRSPGMSQSSPMRGEPVPGIRSTARRAAIATLKNRLATSSPASAR